MTTGQSAAALFLVIALILPVSALVARGLPRGRVLRLALIWAVIFLVAALIAGLIPSHATIVTLHNTYYQTEGSA